MKKATLKFSKSKIDEVATEIALFGAVNLYSWQEEAGIFDTVYCCIVAFPDDKEDAFKSSKLSTFVKK